MPQLYTHVAIVECSDSAALEETLAAGLQPFVVRRLSPTAVVVDHEQLEEITKRLRRQGQTPKITRE